MGLRFPMLRFGAVLAAGAVLCSFSTPAPAQEAQPPQAEPAQPAAPPVKLPRPQRGDRTQNLDFLFGALSGLGLIMQELGEEKRALEVFRRALAVHPHLERIPDMIKQLTDKVEGRDI